MKYLFLLSALCIAPITHAADTAATGGWGALAAQAMQNPAMQQAAMQAASNPAVQQAVMQQALSGATTKAAAGKGTLATALATLTPEQRALLNQKAQAIAAKLFTAKEQKALTAFQSSAEGSSIMGKMPALMQQLAPVMLQMYMGQGAK